ncbi:MAG: ATP-binding protein [Actinomycetota bacterium]|nr:ATP-binding protein [Actinomycetota bacterium]
MIPRHLLKSVNQALQDTPAVLIVGPRQAGKSTLARALRPQSYVSLDLALPRAAAAADPDGFVAGLPAFVALDEVQRVPELFLAIKAAIDAERRAGRFLLTGSANVLMLPKVADALPGRMQIVTLWPFSQGEIGGGSDRFVDAVFEASVPPWSPPELTQTQLFERVLRGGFPEVLSRAPARRSAWFESYLTAVIEREIRDLANLGNASELTTLVRLIAARNASVLNLADVARDARLAHSTARRHLHLLETIFLVTQVPAWSTNLTSRVVRSPKVMLSDSGLAAHVLGLDRARLDAQPVLGGGLLEGFVAMEVHKQLSWSRVRPSLSHFRSRANEEVDLVLETRDGRVVGLEVKAGSTVRSEDFKGLRALAHLLGDRFVRGIVLHTGSETAAFGPNLWAMPVSALWSLGA